MSTFVVLQPIFEEFIHSFIDLLLEDDSLESVMLATQIAVMTCICCKSCNCCCVPSKKRLKAIEGGDAYDVPGREHIPKKVNRTPEKNVLRANRQTRKELAEWEERRRSLSTVDSGWLFRRSKSETVLPETTGGNAEGDRRCVATPSIEVEERRNRPASFVFPPPPPDLALRRCESEQPKALKSCLVTGQSRRWGSVQDESGLFAEVVPLQGTSSCAFQIKKAKIKKSDSRKGGLKSMKKGFKQFFTQDRSQREYESEHELTPQQGRRGSGGGFFQKLFRGNGKPDTSPMTLSPVGSPMSGRRADWESEDDYAEILNARAKSNERDLNFYPGTFASSKKRELSVPVSPKSVTFEDEISRYGRAESAAPYQSDSRWRSGTSQTSGYGSPGRVPYERDAKKSSHSALDEATLDLLRLSTEPATVTFSSSPRRSNVADKLPKAASTSSMHKVIRTEDGGLLKMANVFTWDADRLKENSPGRASSHVTGEESRKVTEEGDVIEVVQRVEGKPVVRTTVEGKMRMEKVVGAKLRTIDELISAGWTIRDTVTNYKIKTTLGSRHMIVEEERTGGAEDLDTQYRMQMYKDGREIGSHVADISIPSSASKSEYLSKLSEKLMREMAAFEGEQETATTRVEVEVVENVTKLMKTYIVGERDEAEELEQIVKQKTTELTELTEINKITEEKFCVETASDKATPPPIERVNKEYIDQMERELVEEMAKKDIRLTTQGQQFEGAERIVQHKRFESETESVDSVIAKRTVARCANVFADCDLTRTEDFSSNNVFIAIPNELSLEVILRTERVRSKAKQLEAASYGLEQSGHRYEETTTLKRTTRFESAPSEEVTEEIMPPITVEPLTEAEPEIPPPKEAPRLEQKVEEEIIQERTEQVLEKERSEEELREAEPYGGEYSMQQEGQRFEGESVIRRKVQKLVSEESEEEKEPKISEPEGATIDLSQAGQHFEDRAVLKRTRRFESEESEEKEPTEVVLAKDESNGIFTVSIECANSESAVFTTREKRPQKLETVALQMSMQKATHESAVHEKSIGEAEKQILLHHITATAEENVFLSDGLQKAISTESSLSAAATLKDATIWSDSFSALELSEESATIMIALQNHIALMEMEQLSEYNWARKQREQVKSKVRETMEENAMTMYSFASREGRCLSVESLLKDHTTARHSFHLDAAQSEAISTTVSLSCPELSFKAEFKARLANASQASSAVNEFSSEQSSAMVYLKNTIDSIEERAQKTLPEARLNTGSRLDAYAQTHEDLTLSMDLSKAAKFSSFLETGASRAVSRTEKVSMTSSSSSTEVQTANYALNRGGKSGLASVRIVSANTGAPAHYDVIEAGNKVESCAVMMTRGGISGMHASTSWAESVSGESSPEIYDLNTVNITKRMHLSNYKSLLPLHGFAHTTWPPTSHSTVPFQSWQAMKTLREPSVSLSTIISREEIEETESISESHVTEISEKIVHSSRSKSIEYRDILNREEIWEDESISESHVRDDFYRRRMARSMTDVSTYTVDMEEIDVVDSTVKVRKQDTGHTTTILLYEPPGGQTSCRASFGSQGYREIYERIEEVIKSDQSGYDFERTRLEETESITESRLERRSEGKDHVVVVVPQQTVVPGTREEREKVTESQLTQISGQPMSYSEVHKSVQATSEKEEHRVESFRKDAVKEGIVVTTRPSREETYSLMADYSVEGEERAFSTLRESQKAMKQISTEASREEKAEVSKELARTPAADAEKRLLEAQLISAERGFESDQVNLSYQMRKLAAEELPIVKTVPRASEEREESVICEFLHEQVDTGTEITKLRRPEPFGEVDTELAQARNLAELLSTKSAHEEDTYQEAAYMKALEQAAVEQMEKAALSEGIVYRTPSASEVYERKDVCLAESATSDATTASMKERDYAQIVRKVSEAEDNVENLSSQWNWCESDMSAQKTVGSVVRESGSLTTAAVGKESVDLSEHLAMSKRAVSEGTRSEPTSDVAALALKIEQRSTSHLLSYPPESETTESSLSESLSATAKTDFREYLQENVSLAAQSMRITRRSAPEFADAEVNVPRQWSSELDTSATSFKGTETRQEFIEITQSSESEVTFYKAVGNREMACVQMQPSHEESLTMSRSMKLVEDTQECLTVLKSGSTEFGEKSAREYSISSEEFSTTIDTVQAHMHYVGTLKNPVFESEVLRTEAAGDTASQLHKLVTRKEGSEGIVRSVPDSDKASEKRHFAIEKKEITVGFQHPQSVEAESARIAEANKEGLIGSRFIEYSEQRIATVEDFRKIADEKWREGEDEYVHPIPRQLQQHLSTTHATEEKVLADFERDLASPVSGDSFVKAMPNPETITAKFPSATTETSALTSDIYREDDLKSAEAKIKSFNVKHECGSVKEPSVKSIQLSGEIDIVTKHLTTAKSIAYEELEQHLLSTAASQESTAELQQHVLKEGKPMAVTNIVTDMMSAEEKRRFEIESRRVEAGFRQRDVTDAGFASLKDTVRESTTTEPFLEYTTRAAEAEAVFKKVSKQQIEEEEEEHVHALPRQLQQSLSTEFAREESAETDVQKACSPSASSESFVRKIAHSQSLAKSMSSATHEESALSWFMSRTEDSNAAESKMRTANLDSQSTMAKEARKEEANLSEAVEIVATALQTTQKIVDAEVERQLLNTVASQESTAELQQHVLKEEKPMAATNILTDMMSAEEKRRFEIESRRLEAGFRQRDVTDAGSASLKDTIHESTTAEPFLEYTTKAAEAEAVFRKVTKLQTEEEEREHVHSVPRQLQQSLSTVSAQEESAETDVQKACSPSASSESFVRKIAHSESLTTTLASATHEESALSWFMSRTEDSNATESKMRTANLDSQSIMANEPREESSNLSEAVEIVATALQTTQKIVDAEVERQLLNTVASQESTAELQQHVLKEDRQMEAGNVLKEMMSAEEKRRFEIESRKLEAGFQQGAVADAGFASLKDTIHESTTTEPFLEYTTRAAEAEAVFKKVSKPQIAEEEQEHVHALPRQLQQSLSTEFAREESAETDVQKACSPSASSESFVRKIAHSQSLAKSMSSATHEESALSWFMSRTEDSNAAESKMRTANLDSQSIMANEPRKEEANLSEAVEIVATALQTTQKIVDAEVERQLLNTVASQESTVELQQHVLKEEKPMAATNILTDMMSAEEKRRFEIESRKLEAGFQQGAVADAGFASLKDTVRESTTTEPFLEYTTRAAEAEAVFKKVSKPQIEEEEEEHVHALPRQLQQSLSTEFAKDESAETDVQKACSPSASSESFVRKIAHSESLTTTLASATHEESALSWFMSRTEDSNATESKMRTANLDSQSIMANEPREESSNLSEAVEIVATALQTTQKVPYSEVERQLLNAAASQESTAELQQHVLKEEKPMAATNILTDMMSAEEKRRFEIESRRLEAGFRQGAVADAGFASLKDTVRESTTTEPFLEYTTRAAEAEALFKKVSKPQMEEEEREHVHSVPRQLQQSLSTEFAKEESAETDVHKACSPSASSESFVRKIAHSESLAKSMSSATHEESALSWFMSRTEDSNATESKMRTANLDSQSIVANEPGEERANLSEAVEIVATALQTTQKVPCSEVEHQLLSTAASQESTAELQQHVLKEGKPMAATNILTDMMSAEEQRRFEIESRKLEAGFQQGAVADAGFASLKDTVRESTTTEPFLEYTTRAAEAEAVFKKVSKPQIHEEEEEHVHALPRQLQQSLSTEFAREESAETDVQKACSPSASSESFVRKIAHSQSLAKSMSSATHEESALSWFMSRTEDSNATESKMRTANLDSQSIMANEPRKEEANLSEAVEIVATALQTAQKIVDAEVERQLLNTVASQELTAEIDQQVHRAEKLKSADSVLTDKVAAEERRRFDIESWKLEAGFQQIDVVDEGSVCLRDSELDFAATKPLREFISVQSEAEAVFKRISAVAPTQEEEEHVCVVSRHLQQSLSTEFAKEEIAESNVEKLIPPSTSGDSLVRPIANTEALVGQFASSTREEIILSSVIQRADDSKSTDLTLQTINISSNCGVAKEPSAEIRQLSGNIAVVATSLSAMEKISYGESDRQIFSTTASQESTAELQQHVLKEEKPMAATNILTDMMSAEEKRRFEIESQRVEAGFQQGAVADAGFASLKDTVRESTTTEPFLEYTTRAAEAEAVFKKVSKPQIAEEEQEHVHALPRQLQQSLSTEFAREESAETDVQKACSPSASSESFVRKIAHSQSLAKSMSSATHEESALSWFMSRTEDSNAAESKMRTANLDSQSIMANEPRKEEANLSEAVEIVATALQTTQKIVDAEVERQLLNTVASQESTVELQQHVLKEEKPMAATNILTDMMSAEEKRRFEIESRKLEAGFQQGAVADAGFASLKDTVRESTTTEPFLEYTTRAAEAEAVFKKVSKPQIEEEEEEHVHALPRQLQQSLSTEFAKDESAETDVQKACSPSASSESFVRKIAHSESLTTTLASATHEESALSWFMSRTEDSNATESKMRTANLDSQSIMANEPREESSNLSEAVEIVATALQTTQKVPYSEVERQLLNAAASQESTAELQQHVLKEEKPMAATNILTDMMSAEEKRRFEIESQRVEAGFQQGAVADAGFASLKDTVRESTTTEPFLEYTTRAAEAEAVFKKVSKPQIAEEEEEHVHALPRQLQQSLSTVFAREESAETDVQKACSPSASSESFVRKIAHSESLAKSMSSATHEESALSWFMSRTEDSNATESKMRTANLDSQSIMANEPRKEEANLSEAVEIVTTALQTTQKIVDAEVEQQLLNTVASQESTAELQQHVLKEERPMSATNIFTDMMSAEEKRRFEIESRRLEAGFRQRDVTDAGFASLKDTVRESTTTEPFLEYTTKAAEAEAVFKKVSKPQIAEEEQEHVHSVPRQLQQSLSTVSAQEESAETKIEKTCLPSVDGESFVRKIAHSESLTTTLASATHEESALSWFMSRTEDSNATESKMRTANLDSQSIMANEPREESSNLSEAVEIVATALQTTQKVPYSEVERQLLNAAASQESTAELQQHVLKEEKPMAATNILTDMMSAEEKRRFEIESRKLEAGFQQGAVADAGFASLKDTVRESTTTEPFLEYTTRAAEAEAVFKKVSKPQMEEEEREHVHALPRQLQQSLSTEFAKDESAETDVQKACSPSASSESFVRKIAHSQSLAKSMSSATHEESALSWFMSRTEDSNATESKMRMPNVDSQSIVANEPGEERANLSEAVEIVATTLQTTQKIVDAEVERQLLNTVASQESTAELQQHVLKEERPMSATNIFTDMMSAEEKRRFEIESRKLEAGFQQGGVADAGFVSLKDTIHESTTTEPFIEYGIKSTGVEEEREHVYAVPRQLQQSLSTEFAREVGAETEVEKVRIAAAVHSEYRKKLDREEKISKDVMAASCEDSQVSGVMQRTAQESHAEQKLVCGNTASSEKITGEPSDEHEALFKSVATAVGSMKASQVLQESVLESSSLATLASTELIADIEEHIKGIEGQVDSAFTILEKPKKEESREFKDRKESLVVGLSKCAAAETGQINLRESREESATSTSFTQFGKEVRDSVGEFEKISSEMINEEEAETFFKIPRQLQESLSASYASDLSADITVDRQRSESSGETAIVRPSADVESSGKKVEAAMDYEVVLSEALTSRCVEEQAVDDVFQLGEKLSSDKICKESSEEVLGYNYARTQSSSRLQTSVIRADSLTDCHQIATKASSEISSDFDKEIKYTEESSHATSITSLKSLESGLRTFKIDQQSAEKQLEMTPVASESSVQLSDSVTESPAMITLREYEHVTSDSIAHFGRTAPEKECHMGVEETFKLSRDWQEILKTKAAGKEECELPTDFSKASEEAITGKSFELSNSENPAMLTTKSSMIEAIESTEVLSRYEKEYPQTEVLLVEKSLGEAELKLRESSINLKSLSAEWSLVLSDLDAELKVPEKVKDTNTLRTLAATDISDAVDASLSLSAPAFLYEQHFAIDRKEDAQRGFHIADERFSHDLRREEQTTTVSSVAKTDRRTDEARTSVKEVTQEEANAGVILVRRSIGRTNLSKDHAVSVNAVLTQSLNTVSASDVCQTKGVEWTVQEQTGSSVRVLSDVNKEAMSADLKASEESRLHSNMAFAKTKISEDECVAKITVGHAESEQKSVSELSTDAYDILTQWTTVFRDLEAHVKLAATLNMYDRLTAVESTEESINVSECWDRYEDEDSASVSLREPVVDFEKKELHVSEAHVTQSIQKEAIPSDAALITCKEPNRESVVLKTKESRLVKLNAMITLHKISTPLPKSTNELTLNDVFTISAEPLTLKTDAAETDSTTSQFSLMKQIDARQEEVKLVHYNSAPEVILEAEQAGDEKVKMLVDIQGKSYEKEQMAVEWRLPNETAPIGLETEEAGDEHATLYAQLTSKHELEKDADTVKAIGRKHEPLSLHSKASTEETKTLSEVWVVPPQTELKSIMHKIPNTGERAEKRTLESEEHLVSVGFYYDTVPETEAASVTQASVRDLGEYVLDTKASSMVDKTLSFSLLRKQESELQKKRWATKSKSSISLNLLESSVETSTATFNLDRAMSAESVGVTQKCDRTDAPYSAKFQESSLSEETIHCSYNRRNVEDWSAFTQKISNSGGLFILSTDAAEESQTVLNSELKQFDEFSTATKTITDFNSTVPLHLHSLASSSESTTSVLSYERSPASAEDSKTLQCANKGQNIEERMKESREVRQTTYLEFWQYAEKEAFGLTIDQPNFGGRFKLNTDASEESESNSVRTLVSDRICSSTSSLCLVEPVVAAVALGIKASTEATATTQHVHEKKIESQFVEKSFVHKHTESASVVLVESCEAVENVAYEMKRPAVAEDVAKVMKISSTEIPLVLSTNAAQEAVSEQSILLDKERVDHFSTELKHFISNTGEPTSATLKAAEESMQSVTCSLSRLPSHESASLLKICARIAEPVKFKSMEANELSETSNYQFRRAEQLSEQAIVLKECRFGGGAVLSTRSSSETTHEKDYIIASQSSKDESAAITRVIANTSEPMELMCQHSKKSSADCTCAFNKTDEKESTSVTIRIPNEEQPSLKQISESSSITETTNLQFKQVEEREGSERVIVLSREGGHFTLHSSSSSSEDSTLNTEISSKSISSGETSTTRATFRTTEPPELRTYASKVEHMHIETQLARPGVQSSAELVTKTPLRGDSITFVLKESVHLEETSTCELSRPENRGVISEVIKEPQFGGSFMLSTKATQYNSTDYTTSLTHEKPYELHTDIVIIEKRTVEPLFLATSHSQEASVSCTSALQRSGQVSSAHIIRTTPQQGENIGVRISESKEFTEVNNVSLTRHDITSSSEVVVKEPRHGGQLLFRSKRSEESYADLEQTLSRTGSFLDSEHVFKTSNVHVPSSLTCSHCKMEESTIFTELRRLESTHDDSLCLKSCNIGEPLSLRSAQSEERVVNMSTYLDKDVKRSMEKETTMGIPRFGGGDHLHCNAASEKSGEIVLNLLREESSEEDTRVVKISREESTTFGAAASEESVVNSTQSIVRKVEAPHTISVSVRTPLRGEHVEFASRASEQTIFNADCDYTKQPTEFVLNWTSFESRIEPSVALQTEACKEVHTELAETDVRRRLVEYSTESVIERGHREISPVVLYSEQAEETLIRHEQHMESHEFRHNGSTASVRTEVIREEEQMSCEASGEVERREELYSEQTTKTASEKRVSFAAEVTEKTMSLDMDMSMTVERKEAPSIIKKPMKKERERRGRRGELKRNEAPNFVPVRRNSLLMALNIGSPHNIPHFKTLQDIVKAIKEAGLEYSNLIFGIDYTRSNYYQGEKTFDGRSLHSLDAEEQNPYQQVIEIVGKTLSSFDADGIIPVYGFGDEQCTDQSIFNLANRSDPDACCNGFEDVLRVYNERTPSIAMSGPTNFVPLIEKAIDICREKHSYHILVIVADGQVTNEKINQKAIAAASHYPLSIIMVGVGDGPWNMMNRFDETLPKRIFDNFHFVDFHKA
ncbi:hypothetical protein QR680_001365 [Steinernema hermaphroditum]|uniref:VWFA domain-containing protein n=1 Tax=Steinernema hermaphroditum TaxID=289476 RepID=A0AA39LFR8_9BILA|nr:hypothetical protein QR680_001365 [Steinernema hermaphroditum]